MMNRKRLRTRNMRCRTTAPALNARRGFTLIEMLIAITILAGVVLTMAMNTVVSARSVASSGARSRAQAMVDQQISRARTWPTYATMGELAASRYNIAQTGLLLMTIVERDTTAGTNLTLVTVTVMGTSPAVLPLPIKRSIAVAAP